MPHSRFWPHNCDDCVWLGSIELSSLELDLYWHPGDGMPATVVARFGEDPPDYASGLHIAKNIKILPRGGAAAALRIAYLIALGRGLATS